MRPENPQLCLKRWALGLVALAALPFAACESSPGADPSAGNPAVASIDRAPDGGILQSDAGSTPELTAPRRIEKPLAGGLILGKFEGTVDPVTGKLDISVQPAEHPVADYELLTPEQRLCVDLNIVQDGIANQGPANSFELVTTNLRYDASCVAGAPIPLLCGDVTARSFWDRPYDRVFAQLTTLTDAANHAVYNNYDDSAHTPPMRPGSSRTSPPRASSSAARSSPTAPRAATPSTMTVTAPSTTAPDATATGTSATSMQTAPPASAPAASAPR